MTTSEQAEDQSPTRRMKQFLRPESLRLFSGLVLMLFLTLHLLNHSLGLLSLEAMEAGRTAFVALWRSVPGTVMLFAAATTHLCLALYKLLSKRSFRRTPAKEILQIGLGLAIPPLIILHVIGTRFVHEAFGVTDSYTYVLYNIWVGAPLYSLIQSLGLVVAWFHGCLGLHFWLRLKPWYERAYPSLYSLSLILPLLALTGFLQAAREVEALSTNADWRTAFLASTGANAETVQWVFALRDGGMTILILILLGLLASRVFWIIHFRRQRMVSIHYPNGQRISGPVGSTLLEISRLGGIPHASVCGGRGRCSTCRVHISEGADSLPPPSDQELAVLKRVGAAEGTRLACQLQPVANLAVAPLLPAKATPRQGFPRPGYLQGQERIIAILFADLRAFTQFSEDKLPYDVVFVINQYFRHMGDAIEKNGGHLDKFIGDGVMALFGLEDTPESACRKALNAARSMADELDIMNRSLKSHLAFPLRIGIGIHVGSVIVGEMGYGKATSITAIGDAVNTASRLEALSKDFDRELVFSDQVARRAGFTGPSEQRKVEIRGRKDPLTVHIIKDARTLPDR